MSWPILILFQKGLSVDVGAGGTLAVVVVDVSFVAEFVGAGSLGVGADGVDGDLSLVAKVVPTGST